jgi:hypothetical protein
MPLTTEELEAYTNGRLVDGDESERLLAAAYAAARRYCGWPVTLTEDDVVTVDGSGGRVLSLPTMYLVELTALSEDGMAWDVDDLHWTRSGLVRKRGYAPLRWTSDFQGVEATITHGYASAPDFEQAVLMIAASMAGTAREDADLIEKQVDDVRYRWTDRMVESVAGRHLLAPYRILPL